MTTVLLLTLFSDSMKIVLKKDVYKQMFQAKDNINAKVKRVVNM